MLAPSFHVEPSAESATGGHQAIRFARYRYHMSKSESRHPFRKLIMIAALIAAALAFRNAVADKGGSYDPDAR